MSDTPIGTNWTILIVDDQPDNIAVAQTVLEYHGANVHVARNGEAGLALLDQIRPTAILLDLSMPVMDGWEMFRRMRGRSDLHHVPILAVTAHAMDGDRARVLEDGFDDYIAKPYDIHVLSARIQAALENRNMISYEQ